MHWRPRIQKSQNVIREMRLTLLGGRGIFGFRGNVGSGVVAVREADPELIQRTSRPGRPLWS